MRILSCEFNMDTACVELRLSDGTMISIDTIAVENEAADNMYQRSELDWLIYNAPLEYADLILNGDPEKYLKAVTQYKPMLFYYLALNILFLSICIHLPLVRRTHTFR